MDNHATRNLGAASRDSNADVPRPQPAQAPAVATVTTVPNALCTFGARVVEDARANVASKGHAFRGSFTNGAGMRVGYLGEMVFQRCVKQLLGVELKNADTRDYDFLTPGGLRVEVKTKECTSSPRPAHDNSVCCWNTRQCADVYVFLRAHMQEGGAGGTLYFCGALFCRDFRRRARYVAKGEVDASNNFRASADHKSLRMDACRDWKWLSQYLTTK
jgi:hypothetical protein